MNRSLVAKGACALVIGVLILLAIHASVQKNKAVGLAFPPQFSSSKLFDDALLAASTTTESTCVSGLVIPHHLLASDKIARAVQSLRTTKYKRIIILSPDHFVLGTTKISYAVRDFNTAFGVVKTSPELARVLKDVPQASAADFFYREHGIGGLLPFFKKTQPEASILAVALRSDARPRDLDPLISALASAAKDPGTLIVGSIDFSHYLPKNTADQKDAQTRVVFETGSPADVWSLAQPDNLDSKPVLYVVWSLENAARATHYISDHGNSQDYTKLYVDSTTSYFVIYFERSPLTCG